MSKRTKQTPDTVSTLPPIPDPSEPIHDRREKYRTRLTTQWHTAAMRLADSIARFGPDYPGTKSRGRRLHRLTRQLNSLDQLDLLDANRLDADHQR